DGSMHSLQACTAGQQTTRTAVSGMANPFENTDNIASILYPNPAHDLVTIHITGEKQGTVVVHVYSAAGGLIQTRAAVKGASMLDVPVYLSGLAAGVYIVEIEIGGAVWQRQKLLKL
ncbi:MAG TPA: T9SS type A sorting domain-containing protein, partial [Puia sp.]|nr:T9SS type A sorting domain-containing protein [Puia sp.]